MVQRARQPPGTSPGPHPGRYLPATSLAAPAQLRAAAIPNALHGSIQLIAADTSPLPALPQGSSDNQVNDADLRIPLSDASVPVRGGRPCPPIIGSVRPSVAETARLTRLAAQAAAGLISRACLAFALRWSARRRWHQAIARWNQHSSRLLAAAT